MPRVVQWFIKAALIWFVLGLLGAFWMELGTTVNVPPFPALRPLYVHFLVVGWLTQLIFGVAYWMFPRYSKESPRGDERFGWLMFALLNTGLVLRAMGEPLAVPESTPLAVWLLGASALLQMFAAWLFVALMWPRVKER
jgi:cbb3-type cytochrome oxidase subunit 1